MRRLKKIVLVIMIVGGLLLIKNTSWLTYLRFIGNSGLEETTIINKDIHNVIAAEQVNIESFDSLGYDIGVEDVEVYAIASSLAESSDYTCLRMLKYIGYDVGHDEYFDAVKAINEGNYNEAYQLLSKDIGWADSDKIRTFMIRNELVELKVGDVGLAGGSVIYDKGFYSGGWRYLEAAPKDIGKYKWGKSGDIGTSEEIGAGKSNTEKIVQKLGNGRYAAKMCADFVYNGYDDWFLPSKDELRLMLKVVHINIFKKLFMSHWSSSECKKRSAWRQSVYNGGARDNSRYRKHYVRPIRAF